MEITTSWHEKGRAEGRLEGRAEGRAEGRLEGRAEGVAEGVAKGKAETAKNLLVMGMDKKLIAKVTGLTEQEIEKIQNELH